jgi:hypothetical protein
MSALSPLLMLAQGHKPRPRRAPAQHKPKEIALHCAVAKLLREHCLESWQWFHIPNGEARDIRTAVKLKKMGVKAGLADIALISPGGMFHALELKRLGERLSDAQRDFQSWCVRSAVPYSVAYSLDDALEVLSAWNCLRIVIPKRVKYDD